MPICKAKKRVNFDRESWIEGKNLSINQASTGATSSTNTNECVMLLWNKRFSVGESQREARLSLSGKLWAKAPRSNAFLPIFLEKAASPRQAPRTICVSESIGKRWLNYQ